MYGCCAVFFLLYVFSPSQEACCRLRVANAIVTLFPLLFFVASVLVNMGGLMPPGMLSQLAYARQSITDIRSCPGSLRALVLPNTYHSNQAEGAMDIDTGMVSGVGGVEEYDDFPRESAVTVFAAKQVGVVLPTVQTRVSARERAEFLATLPTRVQLKLNQPFGKDNLVQCFKSEACLRLVLLPVYKSGFLSRKTADWPALANAYGFVSTFLDLIDDHAAVDFRQLQGYYAGWNSATSIDDDRVRMATAALLHFDGDIADLIRWMGGRMSARAGISGPALLISVGRLRRNSAIPSSGFGVRDRRLCAMLSPQTRTSTPTGHTVTTRLLLRNLRLRIALSSRTVRGGIVCCLTSAQWITRSIAT